MKRLLITVLLIGTSVFILSLNDKNTKEPNCQPQQNDVCCKLKKQKPAPEVQPKFSVWDPAARLMIILK
jgi:hypothetical protein